MASTISNTASCEVRSVIRFLNEKDVSAVPIHRQVSEVYGPDVIQKWPYVDEEWKARNTAGNCSTILPTAPIWRPATIFVFFTSKPETTVTNWLNFYAEELRNRVPS